MARMPALFIGHGSPMNALERNRYSDAWRALGAALPRPKAVLCLSAHWLTRGLAVTAMQQPKTIHDFGGFPQALFDVQYPAAGSPALAARICELLEPLQVTLDQDWGLDHGAWSVLLHLFPDADVPVVQLSLDATQTESFHYRLGQMLAALRDEGVLLLGTGNVVHNLARLDFAVGSRPAWAQRFDAFVQAAIAQRDHTALVNWRAQGADAALSVPTPEHYWPLLPILGAQGADEPAVVVLDGIELGAISMTTVRVG